MTLKLFDKLLSETNLAQLMSELRAAVTFGFFFLLDWTDKVK